MKTSIRKMTIGYYPGYYENRIHLWFDFFCFFGVVLFLIFADFSKEYLPIFCLLAGYIVNNTLRVLPNEIGRWYSDYKEGNFKP